MGKVKDKIYEKGPLKYRQMSSVPRQIEGKKQHVHWETYFSL